MAIIITSPADGALITTPKIPQLTGIIDIVEPLPDTVVVQNLTIDTTEYPATFWLDETVCRFSCENVSVKDTITDEPLSNTIKVISRYGAEENYQEINYNIKVEYNPTLIDSTIKANDTEVPINAPIILFFNKLMNLGTTFSALTINPTLGGTWNTGDDNSTIFYSYSGELLANTVYTIALQNTATDLFGNAISNPQVISFTTGATKGAKYPTRLGDVLPTNIYRWAARIKNDLYSPIFSEDKFVRNVENQFPALIYPFAHNQYGGKIKEIDEKEAKTYPTTLPQNNRWLIEQVHLGTWLSLRFLGFDGEIVSNNLELGNGTQQARPPQPTTAGSAFSPRGTFGGIETFNTGKPILVWKTPTSNIQNILTLKIELSKDTNFIRPITFNSQYHAEMFTTSSDNGATFAPLINGILGSSTHCKFECPFNLEEGKWSVRTTLSIKNNNTGIIGTESQLPPSIG